LNIVKVKTYGNKTQTIITKSIQIIPTCRLCCYQVKQLQQNQPNWI